MQITPEATDGDGFIENVELAGSMRSESPRIRFEIPVIRSSRPGSFDLTNEAIYDIIEFP